ncbi:MAG: hypothetical protein ABR498_06855 [Candidatus Dormibacteria bacterium]
MAKFAAPLLAAACLMAPADAGASTASFATSPANVSQVSPATPVAPGSWVAVGTIISVKGGSGSATLYLINTRASIGLSCTKNSSSAAFTLSVGFPSEPIPFSSDGSGGGWYPTNDMADSSTYQASTQLPAWCGARPLYIVNKGETYSGTLGSSNDTGDVFHLQFHTAIPAALNNSENINCQTSGSGTRACDFAQNGDAPGLTPIRYNAASQSEGQSSGSPSSAGSPTNSSSSPSNPSISGSGGPSAAGGGPPSVGGLPLGSVGADGSSPAASAGGAPQASPTAPPVVLNPFLPPGPAQLLTALGPGWIPMGLVVAVLAMAIGAALLGARRRRRTEKGILVP